MATGMLKNDIRKVKDLIESRQFIQALMLIKELESEYPSSAQVLVLKALVYAITGHTKALSICSDAIMEALTDTSVLPDVLKTSQIICQILGDEVSATILYRKAMAKDSNNLDLLMGLFQCYVRESSFIDQLLISLNMYKLSRKNKFLMLAVFSIQLQVVSHLVKKHATTHNMDEPENLLVYISVPKQQGEYNHAREILSMLGTTLLVGEVSKLQIKGDMLLARLSDYVAAMEILRQKSETCSDDRQLFLNNLIELLDDDSEWCHPPLVLAHKLSQLSENEFMQNQFGTNLSEALALKLGNLPKEVHGRLGDDELDEVADEYFN
ncbi:hypothetical protein MKW94_012445, partial [Papaver nudicaule]|nr:hypothetical protein [Papaver nudicaule]